MSIELTSAPSPHPLRNPQAPTVQLGGLDDANADQSSAPSVWLSPAAQTGTGETVGRYPVSGEIARGGMGAILRGHDPNLGRDLAIKVLLDAGRDPEQVRRFVEEAQIAGQLQHPGIVPVYEIGLYADNRPYFTMKLVEGRTLFHLLWERTDPAHDLPRFLGIFQHVCLTIAYAHERGVIHRDLKPGNIMVGSFGEVLVMDWGLAKVLNRADQAPDPTPTPRDRDIRTIRTEVEGSASAAGTVSGTPAYMAPEQARGENERVDKRADVFALGSILCEILTGQPAYVNTKTDDTYFRALVADLGGTRARLDGCGADPQLLQLARRCLEPEPDARPSDAGIVAAEITAYLNGVQERLRQAELERAAARAQAAAEKRSRRLKIMLAGLLALTVFGVAMAASWSLEKRAQLRHEVESDLTVAEQAEANGQWAEARAAAERAGGRLGGSGPEDLQHRLQRVGDDLDMLAQLDQIRLKHADITDGHFNRGDAVAEYAAAFQKFDLDVLTLETGEAARRLHASAIAEPLLAALDDWLLLLDAKDSHWQHLLDTVQEADGDGQRTALRSAWAAQDWTMLRHLANPQTVTHLPPSTALFVSGALLRAKATDEAIQLLEAAQRAHPADFWLNHRLAYMLDHYTNRREEAVGYYRAAVAIRPNSPGVYVNLSIALEHLGRHDEAEDAARKAIQLKDDFAEAYINLAYFLSRRDQFVEAEEALQKALALKPNDAEFHHDFGAFLLKRGRIESAKEEFEKAVRLKPDHAAYYFQAAYALHQLGAKDEAERAYRAGLALDGQASPAHTNLGALLFDQGRYAEAEQEHRAAIAADPQLAVAHLNLGITLARQDQFVEAESAFRQAIALGGDVPEWQCRLGQVLCAQGRFREGRDLLHKGHERGASKAGWNLPSQQWLKAAERNAQLEEKLPAVLADAAAPKDAAEWLEFAAVCQAKRQYAGAVKCYQSAFAAQPNLATDYRHGGGRGAAARAAVLAASGQDVEYLNDATRARLRQQALTWLRADVMGWSRNLETGSAEFRDHVRQALASMRLDPALAAVRDDAALEKLPEEQRGAFRQLWRNVAELSQRLEEKEE